MGVSGRPGTQRKTFSRLFSGVAGRMYVRGSRLPRFALRQAFLRHNICVRPVA